MNAGEQSKEAPEEIDNKHFRAPFKKQYSCVSFLVITHMEKVASTLAYF